MNAAVGAAQADQADQQHGGEEVLILPGHVAQMCAGFGQRFRNIQQPCGQLNAEEPGLVGEEIFLAVQLMRGLGRIQHGRQHEQHDAVERDVEKFLDGPDL